MSFGFESVTARLIVTGPGSYLAQMSIYFIHNHYVVTVHALVIIGSDQNGDVSAIKWCLVFLLPANCEILELHLLLE